MSSIADEKAALRNTLRQSRANRALSQEDSERLSEQLGQFCLDQKLSTVAAYYPISGEPDIKPFLDWALSGGIKVLLPVVSGQNLDWVEFDGKTNFGSLGFEEGSGKKAKLESAEAIFVPALAVDLFGNRLGKGKGFYDRALASAKQKTIAVVFDEEILLSVPMQEHDRRMSAAISPSKLIWFSR